MEPKFQQLIQQQQQQRMQYRRGFNDAGFTLTDEDDLPMWSTKTLTTVKPLNFFDVGGGPNELTSLATPFLIDMTKDFDVRRIEVNFMASDKAPLEAADVALISKAVHDYYLTLKINESKFAWWAPLSALVKFPMAVAAAGASAYNPAWIVNGGANINPSADGRGTLIIKGGVAFQLQLSSSVNAQDLTGLDMNIALWGKRYALVTAQT